MTINDDPNRLALKGITKAFPGVVANDDVSFSVAPGEIHALLGENGAGKSTLVKIIYGVQRADHGQIFWNGSPITITNPKMARHLGIGMVFQHFSLFDAMTVLENITLGMDKAIPRKALRDEVEAVLSAYQLPLEPDREVHSLSVGERQRIEIVRSLLQRPRLLIMDEPTSVLTPQEVDRLFETLRQLADEGCSILYISHKLHEIKALCDTATILRGGKVVADCDPSQETAKSMAELMIGTDLKDVRRADKRESGKTRFQVNALSVKSPETFGIDLKDIQFAVASGEIFGIAGVAGNGQNELLSTLAGEADSQESGDIQLDGFSLANLGPSERRKLGLCTIPEERNGHGAVPSFTLSENTVLTARERIGLVSSGFIKRQDSDAYAGNVIENFAVKASGTQSLASSLSGGNLQKFMVGREILQSPGVLLVAQATWGVDAGAAAAIHQALIDLAASGTAIILISQDLDEIFALCDRLAVINEGRLSEPLDVATASLEEIGLLMGGVHGETTETVSPHRDTARPGSPLEPAQEHRPDA